MSPERSKRVDDVFRAVAERSSSVSEELLRQECGGDEELLAEIRRRLQSQAGGPAFVVGQIVAGRYRILRFIGRGGMGEVFEAEDIELKEHVALKTVLPAVASDPDMIARFKQEIQLSRKISHPNVCRVFDLARHPVESSSPETTWFLTMEFLPGETLSARLQAASRMTVQEARPLVEQMAEALEAAHSAGVIHRDFKPSNVMLVPSAGGERAVVTDFGLARSHVEADEATNTLTGKVMGTLDYMAPELLSGAIATYGSDVYALGMVVYRMVAGVLPFPSEPLASAILRSRQTVPSPRSFAADLDEKWERAIMRALEPEPGRRYKHPREFVEDIRGDTGRMTLRLPTVTRRRALAAAVVVLATVVGFLGWRRWQSAGDRPPAEAVALYRRGADDLHAGAYFAASRAFERAVAVAPRYALAHARLAEASVELDLTDKASQEMLVVRRQDLSRLPAIDRLLIEAVDLRITREFAEAVDRYEKMIGLAGAQAQDVYVDLGRAYERAGKSDKAAEAWRHAAEGKIPNPAAWLRLGIFYSRGSDAMKSEDAFHRAEEIYQQSSNLEGLTELAYQRGVAAARRGQLDASSTWLNRAIETARLAGNVQQEIRAKLQLSNNAYLGGDAALTERYAREALDTAQASQMEIQAVSGVINLGNAYRRKLDLVGAERYYQEALALARRNSSPRLIALSQLSLAALHDDLHRSDESAREARDALQFYEPNHWVTETLQGLALLGRAQINGGDYAGAEEAFRKLGASAEKANNRAMQALAYESLGRVAFDQEQYPGALDNYRKDLDFKPGEEQQAFANLQMGITLTLLGRISEGTEAFDRADGASSKFAALRQQLVGARAESALVQNRFADAAALARRALDSEKSAGTVVELKGILAVTQLHSGKSAEATRTAGEALADALKLGQPRVLFSARMAMMGVHPSEALMHDLEPAFANHPESRWRALALMGRASEARQALDELGRQWHADILAVYLTRPDIQSLIPKH